MKRNKTQNLLFINNKANELGTVCNGLLNPCRTIQVFIGQASRRKNISQNFYRRAIYR